MHLVNLRNLAYGGIVAAAVGAAMVPNAASASPINVGGVVFDPSAVVFSLGSVLENQITAVGQTLSGIGQITDIERGVGGSIVWHTGDNNVELTYAFSGYKLENFFANPITGGLDLLFSGGIANFFVDSSQDFTVSSGNAGTDLTSATNGTPWLTLQARGNATCTVLQGCASGVGTEITLVSHIDSAALGGTINTGGGNGFFDVIAGPGIANGNFDTNSQAGGRDIQYNTSFSTAGAASTDFALGGSIDARSTAIPEPATVGLLGLGLAAFGFLSLRRRRRSA